MPFLLAVDGPLKGQRFPLGESAITLGRSFDTDIQIYDLMVTRRHCKISPTPRGYVAEDLGSSNGTFVNDQRISGPTTLKHGDLLNVHGAVFRFAEQEEAGSTVTFVDRPEDEESAIVQSVNMSDTALDGKHAPAGVSLDSLARAHQRLHTIVEIGNAVGTHVHLDDLVKEIMDSLFRVFPQMERGFIMMQEEGSDDMQVKITRHRDETAADTIAVSRHIVNEAIRQRIGILSADAMDDTRFANAGSVVNFQIRSMMCAPLMAAGEVLGVIHADTTRQDNRFTVDDLEFFTSLANQTATAISYARMHEHLLKRQRMEHDLALAQHVQHSFLPGELPEIPKMEFCATYKAALEVGGDFYDFIPLNDGRLGIVIGDVMGKGMSAALMMVRMMSDVRFLAMSEARADTVLKRLNEGLFRRGIENAFITMVFMILDPKSRLITIANAAHCPPLLRKGATTELIEIGTDSSFAIGAMEDTRYSRQTVSLEAGDCVIAFTDGVPEAQNPQEELYGMARLTESLSLPKASASVLMQKLLDDVRAYVGDTPQSDDLTVICFSAS